MRRLLLTMTSFLLALSGNSQQIINYTTAEGLIDNSVNYIAIDHDEAVWFGTQNGISKWDGTSWTEYTTSNSSGLVHNTISCIAFESDNTVWVGTDFGVSHFDGTTWTTYDQNSGLADNRVRHIFIDDSDVIWIGSSDGVSIFDGQNWWALTSADGIPFGGITHISEDRQGNLFFSTPLSGILVFDGMAINTINTSNGLLSNSVTSTASDANGHLWVGTSDGISVFNDQLEHIRNHTRVFELAPPDTLNPVVDIKIDAHGQVWAGVYVDYLVTEGGVSIFDGSDWTDLETADGLVGPVVRNLSIDGMGNVWVATSTGASKILTKSVATHSMEAGLVPQIYPNPATDLVYLTNHQQWDLVHVIDQYGRSWPIRAGYNTLDVSPLPAGIYYFQFKDRAGHSAVEKLIIR